MTSTAEELEDQDAAEASENLPRMTLIEHLEELRRRLVFSVIAVFIAFVGCWYASPVIFSWLSRPIDRYLPEGTSLAFTALVDPFMLYVKVALLAAIFVASPVLLIQLWLFLKPGLYPRERRMAIPFVIFTSLFFIAGGLFGYEIAFPMVVKFLLGVGEGFQPVVTIQSYFSMLSKTLLGLGLVFELPVLIFFLARFGLVTAGLLLRWLRWAILVIFIIAAVITPTPDVATQTVFAVPMIILYLLGVLVAWLFGKKREE